ncbi:glucuronyl esterase domain-containing protein [Portibacter lacus]|uniref:Acetylxylan esterase n=1 Tax=Portibacter lacus TaxID=1099794 RepID=A0AA37SR72_9BACT|nr:hypothetical protein [Portibacter lacus]GLR18259.1 acetylxylan esterase [Portibacter lacus]
MNFRLISIIIGFVWSLSVYSQPKVNYDEKAIKPYVLPELLVLSNGQEVKSVEEWEHKRREEIFDLFKSEVYGRIPDLDLKPTSEEIIEQSDMALNNSAIREQISMVFSSGEREITINILVYLPKNIESPPVFVGYNFYGNQTTTTDQHVIFTDSWVRNNTDYGIVENRATEESRGKRNSRWPIQKIIDEGFGIATIYYGDVDPDKNDFSDGIHPFFYEEGMSKPKTDEWGSISAWAWGYSKVLDYLKTDRLLTDSKFIVFGHSRLGKTSLWAGALDTRFDIVISNDSGSGGAALFKRKFGETAAIINANFPHWFNANFKKYSNNEDALSIDQHMLVALVAPRPVYIASAEEDKWADPKGEYLSGYHASPVYNLYGKKGLPELEFPETNESIHNSIGYHVRTGKHDVTDYDWDQFIKFAKKHFNY